MSENKKSKSTEKRDGEWFSKHPMVVTTVFWMTLFSAFTSFLLSSWNSKETFYKDQIQWLKDDLGKKESATENYRKESLRCQELELQKTRITEDLERIKSTLKNLQEAGWQAKYESERLEHSSLKEQSRLTQIRLESQIGTLDSDRKSLTQRILEFQKQLDERPFKNGEKLSDTLSTFEVLLKEKAALRETVSTLKSELSEKENEISKLKDKLAVASSSIEQLKKLSFNGSPTDYPSRINTIIASLNGATFDEAKAAIVKRGVASVGDRISGPDFVRILTAAHFNFDPDASKAIIFCAPYLQYPLDEKSMAGILSKLTYDSARKEVVNALMDAQEKSLK